MPCSSQAAIESASRMRAARLDDRGHAGLGRGVHVVAEREERVRRQHATLRAARRPCGPRSATESTRLICPAPTPTTCVPFASTIALLLTCLHTSQANQRSSRSACGRLPLGDHLPLGRVVGPDVAGLDEQAAVDAAVVEPLRAAVERAGLQQADVLLPLLEDVEGLRLVVRGDDALDEPLRLRSMSAAAVSASTGWLNARMPPNADCGSPSQAARNASASVARRRRPARVVVLDDDRRRLGELADEVQGRVEVEDVVVAQFLAVQLLGGGDAGRAWPGRRRTPPSGAGSRRSAGLACD